MCALNFEAGGELGELAGGDGADVCVFRSMPDVKRGNGNMPVEPTGNLHARRELDNRWGSKPFQKGEILVAHAGEDIHTCRVQELSC